MEPVPNSTLPLRVVDAPRCKAEPTGIIIGWVGVYVREMEVTCSMIIKMSCTRPIVATVASESERASV